MKTKAVLYCRVSTKEQEETGYSLPSQEKLLTEYAERKDLDVIRTFAIAESASGAKQRVIFAEMMAYLTKNNIHVLLCEKVDRLTRNMKEAVVANDWIEEDENRHIHFVKQNLDIHKFAKSDEKFRWDIEIVLAKKFISNLSEEVKKGQAEKISQGGMPAKPPMGYKTIGDKGHKSHIIDENYAPFIRKIFEYYGSGNYSMRATNEKVYQEGLRTVAGKKLMKGMLDQILRNPFYCGSFLWKGKVYKGIHESIVSKELYDKVQHVRTRKVTPHYSKHSHQFRKMMACIECGGTITGETQKGTVYYHCSHYHQECTQKRYFLEGEIEEQLFDAFNVFSAITAEEAEQIKTKIKANHAQEIEYKENTLRTLNDSYNRSQKRLDNLYDDRLDGKISMEFWEKKQSEIKQEQEAVLQQISKMKSEEAKYFEIWLNILDLATRAQEIYEKRNPEERRLLLSHIFSNMELSDEKLNYTLKKPVEALAKRIQGAKMSEKIFERQKSLAAQSSNAVFINEINTLLPR
jgi:site-specific DNA recombinase